MLKAIGPVGNSPVNELMLAWWDHFLKGKNNGVSFGPTVNYFEMGANVWKAAGSWPLPGTRWTKYYLESDGHANSVAGDGALTTTVPRNGQVPDRYTYQPWNPVPSVGGTPAARRPAARRVPTTRCRWRNVPTSSSTPPRHSHTTPR